MKSAALLFLLLATPASAFTSMTGTMLVTSCPVPTCTVTSSGQSATVDGEPDASLFVSAYALGEQSLGATGSCVNNGPYTHRFRIYSNSVLIFEDTNAAFNVTRVSNCPTQVIITGTNPSSYSVVLDNPHTDSFGRLAFDFTFTSSVGVNGQGGSGDDPPIVRH
jgi:hypothetical protein